MNPGPELKRYVEIKVGGSGEIWKDGTLGVTVFYSPDYQSRSGPDVDDGDLVRSGFAEDWHVHTDVQRTLGCQTNEGTAQLPASFGNTDDNYVYWNVGLTLGFLEKWSLDFRYWDTNVDNNGPSSFCEGPTFHCDERFVATLKFTY